MRIPLGKKTSVAKAKFGKKAWKMVVHASGKNEMSRTLRQSGSWNNKASRRVLAALKALGPRSMLVDVGANVGWYTLLAAQRHHHVLAFEASAESYSLLRASLCLAPRKVRGLVRVLPYALGNHELHGATCELWRHPNDAKGGDTHNICVDDSPNSKRVADATVRRLRTSGFQREGMTRVRALDELIGSGIVDIPQHTPVVVKLDGTF